MMADGHLNKCKTCTKKDVKENRVANSDYYDAYERERRDLPHRVALRERVVREWQMKHPDRKYAHGVVARALRSGKLQKLPCWVCGAEAEAHHPDYSSPLDVVWLCDRHHKQAHVLVKETG